jgi:hypothetical protein
MAKTKVWLTADDCKLAADLGVQFFPCPVRGDGNGNPKSSFGFPVSSFEQTGGLPRFTRN